MPLISYEEYRHRREHYCYHDGAVQFEILQTGGLSYVGPYQGIFPRIVPSYFSIGVNLRKFEKICQAVFKDCDVTDRMKMLTEKQIENLKAVTSAIVHWKMASQGGRAYLKVENMLSKWNRTTHKRLLEAYRTQDIAEFRIAGIRIPTASALLRFLYPGSFGVIDSRVAKVTNASKVTDFSVRRDGYINDTKRNIREYENAFLSFLRAEASELNNAGVQFHDYDEEGKPFFANFKPCDIEMALFERGV